MQSSHSLEVDFTAVTTFTHHHKILQHGINMEEEVGRGIRREGGRAR
jgi:hypothetical protein